MESAADKTLCCGFCTGGLVSITAHTDKAGYAPGKFINMLIFGSLLGVWLFYTYRRIRVVNPDPEGCTAKMGTVGYNFHGHSCVVNTYFCKEQLISLILLLSLFS